MNEKEGFKIEGIIASLCLFGFGLLTGERGMFWIAESDAVIKDSDLYVALNQIMPLSIWGVFFFLGGVCLILGSVFLPSINHSKKAALFIMIGGLISSIFYFIMSTVGVYNALNWLSWVQYLTFWALTAILTFVGGSYLWQKK
ncbi:hypothetical protein RSA37_11920 [Mammaliicoccus sciuri]|uniref:hypothetical protein n=1 Tax=Mammaliicoccus sciuri TaxID=1296 RepID=UPI00073453FE|nr:hypothetical protein [Mammaliicoccus sciuri]KTT82732.1 hypothetical protein NS1R_12180 [Mammaliicoccus sciuri]KTT88211.1 hypothetical protein NS112_09310 [Mammaliicoccus sciuri]KTT89754.1 hypothetical protein NS36R_07835 [Mammaliicoccus sciuri]KTT94146.1 hypothetical protein NS44R_08250 [Mammaliicoccus sciuri]KTW10748.1 hypothetical protein RSA37_11920 [Mammaliicoccus sciuri]